ncbi:hypothetical protein L1D31_22530, partial [Vibrio sp. Isolate23]|uniref:hypothetical protein n=1 Tax=Vibrio sp. Isolate23 TaxID=2908533 RepID=UPI001EFC35D1
SDGTESEFSPSNKTFYRGVHEFDEQGFRSSDKFATGSWPTDRQLAGAEGRWLFWDNNTFHYFLDTNGHYSLDLTQDPLSLSELGKGKPQPDWSNKRLVGVAEAWEWRAFFWHDGTHSLY